MLAVALWLHSTVTQMLWIWLLSWGSCHDNCTAGGEWPVPELLQRARFHPQSEWLWNIAGTRDPSLYFCQCLLLSQWVKYANGLDRYLGREKEELVSLKADFCITSLISWLYQMILTLTSKFHVGMQC